MSLKMFLLNPRKDLLTFVLVGALTLAIVPRNVMCQNCGCAPDLCCSQYGYCGTGDQYCGAGCQEGPCTSPSTNDFVVADVVTPEFFDGIKNQANGDCPGKSFYTRDVFLSVLDSYPEFGRTGTADDSKREVAAFFAHVTHETGHMCAIEEYDKTNDYCNANDQQYPCAPGKFYYGRGPIQLTGNRNYGAAGEALQFDGLNSPESVAQDATLSFKTAFWFWMTNVHSALNQGFGATIKRINPGECNNGNEPAVEARIGYYKDYCNKFGVDPGQNLSC